MQILFKNKPKVYSYCAWSQNSEPYFLAFLGVKINNFPLHSFQWLSKELLRLNIGLIGVLNL